MKTLFTLAFILTASLAVPGQCGADRARFASLPAAEKVALWDAHLIDYEAKHFVTLTPHQIAVIEFARRQILPFVYERRHNKRLLDAWRQELLASFTLKEGAEIFEKLPRVRGDAQSLVSDCNCSTWWTFCDVGSCSTSCTGCGSCTRIIDCGPFYAFQCNGRCWQGAT